MAAKLVKPDKVVLAVVGDGGFLMNSQVIDLYALTCMVTAGASPPMAEHRYGMPCHCLDVDSLCLCPTAKSYDTLHPGHRCRAHRRRGYVCATWVPSSGLGRNQGCGVVLELTLLTLNLSVKELATAVSMKMDLTILILNDDAYGMIKWKQVTSSARAPLHLDGLRQ